MKKSSDYCNIKPGGADTGTPINVAHRIGLVQHYVELAGSRILDCGCGRGEYLRVLAQHSNEVSGVEYDAQKVKDFFAHAQVRAEVKVGNVENLEFANDTFDFVLMNEVLDHVANEKQALGEVFRVLKPGGRLALFTPNRIYPFETHGVALKASGTSISHLMPFIPYIPLPIGNRLFVYFARNYWPWQLKRLACEAGFEIVKQTFVWQTFENNTQTSPKALIALSFVLRKIAFFLEKLPILNAFGVSLLVIARKPISQEIASHHAQ